MSGAARLSLALAWLDDRLPPIMVKEARQAVRSRFVAAVQMLLLAVLVVLLGRVLLAYDDGDPSRTLGRNVFFGFYMLLHIVTVFCVPLYVGVRMAAERNETHVDLLFATTLSPWSVVVGKMVSGLLVGFLAIAACAPFMALCYFLRGVDLSTIIAGLWINLVMLAVATLLAVFIGALAVGPVVKVVAALAYLVLAWMSVQVLDKLFLHLAFDGGSLLPLAANSARAAALVVTVLLVLSLFVFLFTLTVSMLSPPTANRALPVRVCLTVIWLFSASVAVLINFAMIKADFGHFKSWAITWSVLLALATLVGASERDKLGPRMLAQIPRHPKGDMGAFLMYSGAAGGLFWAGCLVFATLVFTLTSSYVLDKLFHRPVGAVSEIRDLALRLAVSNIMVLGYVLWAGWLRRVFLARHTRPVHTGLLAAGLMLAGFLLPLLGDFLLGREGDAKPFWLHAFAPFAIFLHDPRQAGYVPALAVCAVVALTLLIPGFIASLPWLLPQVRVFYASAASLDAHGPRAQTRGDEAPLLAASPGLALGAREREINADPQTGGDHV